MTDLSFKEGLIVGIVGRSEWRTILCASEPIPDGFFDICITGAEKGDEGEDQLSIGNAKLFYDEAWKHSLAHPVGSLGVIKELWDKSGKPIPTFLTKNTQVFVDPVIRLGQDQPLNGRLNRGIWLNVQTICVRLLRARRSVVTPVEQLAVGPSKGAEETRQYYDRRRLTKPPTDPLPILCHATASLKCLELWGHAWPEPNAYTLNYFLEVVNNIVRGVGAPCRALHVQPRRWRRRKRGRESFRRKRGRGGRKGVGSLLAAWTCLMSSPPPLGGARPIRYAAAHGRGWRSAALSSPSHASDVPWRVKKRLPTPFLPS